MYEELVGLASIQGQTKGSDFHHRLQKHLQALYLDLCKLVGPSNYQEFSTTGAQNSTIYFLLFSDGKVYRYQNPTEKRLTNNLNPVITCDYELRAQIIGNWSLINLDEKHVLSFQVGKRKTKLRTPKHFIFLSILFCSLFLFLIFPFIFVVKKVICTYIKSDSVFSCPYYIFLFSVFHFIFPIFGLYDWY